jgi:raffinose/stachyose/melibiose transport system substrate-binding protein
MGGRMDMKTKKIIAMGLAAAMTAGMLAGCGSKNTGTESQAAGSTTSAAASTQAAEATSTAAQTSAAASSTAAAEGTFTADESLKGQSITFLNSKGEIQEALEDMAADFEKETGIKVEIQACGTGEVPYTKVTSAYNSGNAPTMAMLDTTDIVALAKDDALDLTGEGWTSECSDYLTKIDDKVYSFPFCIEGRGLIYNKDAIDKTLGTDWDPSSVNSYDSLKSLLEQLSKAGMETPVVISHEDWSLGAHQLGYIYDTYDGTTKGSAECISKLEDGSLAPADYPRFTEFMDTLDLLLKYNINKDDPNGSLYDQDALYIAEGDAAFWANGCWAWQDMKNAGADENGNYGFIPFVLGNDTSDFANTSMQASPTKQVMIDKVQATPEQQAAAKEFLSWMVYSATGQNDLVTGCAIIPACKNNTTAPADPLGKDIQAKMASGNTYSSAFVAPSDHWSVMGAVMQKYIGGKTDRAGVAKELAKYWSTQKK